ncbi:MAG: bifunctional oligoribonuclease/PAP phosphatase NrnA [Bacteroidota bacterium]
MQKIEAFKELIKNPQKVVITTHFKPDADALGSSLALAGFLKKLNHQVNVITPSDYPEFLNWMNGNDEVVVFERNKNNSVALKLIREADIIFCLDFSALSRINDLEIPVKESIATKVMIDHHINPEDFAAFEFHNTKAAATAEIIYDLIVELGQKELIDVPIGECIYAGLMTDTGSFRHPSTTSRTHQIAGELIDLGVNTNKIHRNIFDSFTEERLKFLGFMLSEKLKVLPEYNLAYFTVTNEELKRFNSQTGDTEGIVNYALTIKGIAMAAIIVERPEAIKMSFRSIESVAVNDIASVHFSGGGHKNAAGGKTEGIGLAATEAKFLEILPLYKARLTENWAKQN